MTSCSFRQSLIALPALSLCLAAEVAPAGEFVGSVKVVRESDVLVPHEWVWSPANSRLSWLAPLDRAADVNEQFARLRSIAVDANRGFVDEREHEGESLRRSSALCALSFGMTAACDDTDHVFRVFDQQLRVSGALTIPPAYHAGRINGMVYNAKSSLVLVLCDHPARILAIDVADPKAPRIRQVLLTDRRAANDQETVMPIFESPKLGVGAARCSGFVI